MTIYSLPLSVSVLFCVWCLYRVIDIYFASDCSCSETFNLYSWKILISRGECCWPHLRNVPTNCMSRWEQELDWKVHSEQMTAHEKTWEWSVNGFAKLKVSSTSLSHGHSRPLYWCWVFLLYLAASVARLDPFVLFEQLGDVYSCLKFVQGFL